MTESYFRERDGIALYLSLRSYVFLTAVFCTSIMPKYKMWDEKGSDKKVLAVPVSDPQWNWVKDLNDVPSQLLREITHFFQVYKDLEQKETRVGAWCKREQALEIIQLARERYQSKN